VIGTKLGPYEITAKLGEGGMGEVWRATDTKLKRDVAIKVLPEAFTEDGERLARFEREAQVLAQLQHPNIASIYGMEESGEVRALVMELVEGPTLAERLGKGPLPLEESLSVARQIAQALEEAHEKGIVHRDLKPQNIKAATDGKVKVLDFGLAKAMDPGATASGAVSTSPTLLNSPTLTSAGTQLGVILGTAAYMAPEQARGGRVDKRADIWAFGVVLFEMLTGSSLFAEGTVSDTLAGVLKSEIDLGKVPESTPAEIRRLLRRCLERNPKNRLHDIADARIVFDEVLAGDGESEARVPAAPPVPGLRRALPWMLAALGFGAALLALLFGRPGAVPPEQLSVDVAAPEGTRFHFQGDYGAPVVLSPDGSLAAFGAVGEDGKTVLWVRSLATGEARRLEGTADATAPFFSPDGRSLGYFAGGKLSTVPVGGGPSLRVADAANGRGGAWLPDGTIVFSPDYRTELFRVRATGGTPEKLTTLDRARHSSHRWPMATADGRAVVYLATNHESAKQKESELRWIRLDGEGDHALVPSLANGVAAGDRLLFVRDKTLFAQPFDAASGELSGDPEIVAQDVLIDPSTWRATFAVAAGRLLYSPAGAATGSHLSRVERTGRPIEELAPDGVYGEVALSPDGRRLAVGRGTPSDIWVLDLERKTFGRFSFEAGDEQGPTWSRDGRWLYYTAFDSGGGGSRVYRKAADGAAAAELIHQAASSTESVFLSDVSRDGRRLLVQVGEFPVIDNSDLATIELGPPARLEAWIESPATEGGARFSPDDRWVVYSSTESGVSQIYVRSAPGRSAGDAARWQLSVDGGSWPIWSRDGSEIVYLEASLNLTRVAVADDGAGGLRFGTPEALFGTTLVADSPAFDLAPDGRSLILNHFGEAQSRPLRLLLSWRAPRP